MGSTIAETSAASSSKDQEQNKQFVVHSARNNSTFRATDPD